MKTIKTTIDLNAGTKRVRKGSKREVEEGKEPDPIEAKVKLAEMKTEFSVQVTKA